MLQEKWVCFKVGEIAKFRGGIWLIPVIGHLSGLFLSKEYYLGRHEVGKIQKTGILLQSSLKFSKYCGWPER